MTTLYQDELNDLGINPQQDWADNFLRDPTPLEERVNKYEYLHKARRDMVHRYAWAIPDEKAMEIMAKYAPIVEMGAGTGYWAAELQARGVDIAPFDAHPPLMGYDHGNGYWKNSEADYSLRALWTLVQKGSHEYLTYFPDHTLFICWPPMDQMAFLCLQAYKGNTFIYVGEGPYGCNADEIFFDALEQQWNLIEEHDIPQWSGINDYLSVYRRK